MKKSFPFFILILIVFLFSSFQNNVLSYPRFAAYTGDKCSDCHVNPSGGSMRHGGGLNYAEKNLSMDMFKKLAGKTQFSPKLTKEISIGGDVRVAQVDNEVPGSTNYNIFLAMQGDVYVNAKLNNILSVFANSGIQIPGIDAEYEVFGMISKLPANLYFKVGRFKPNYGTRIVEHRAYQRKFLLNTPYDENTGFELGISPEWFNLNVGLYNPQNLDFLGMFPLDPHKMFVASTDFNFGFNNYNFNVNIGGSFFNNPYNIMDSDTTTITANRKAWGVFTRIGIMKRVALIGEVDFEENKTASPLRRSLYGFGELDIILIKGLELRGQFEIRDRIRNREGDDIKRVSAGIAAFPFFGFETEAMIRFVTQDPDVKYNEFQWNFHFYF